MTDAIDEAGFGLYIHWPFCEAKCPYCDFNSHVSDRVDHDRWRDALLRDLRHQAVDHGGRLLNSIFFGGGTPSRMEPETVAAIIDEARRLWRGVNDLEVTLEANPTSVEASKFDAFARAGVNRLSLGIQSLRDPDLRALGRTHDVAQALNALTVARDRFARVSFDLIYARQHQSSAGWQAELDDILTLEPDHLSLYQLTLEPGTVFTRRAEAGRLPGLPDEESIADLYLATNARLEAAGLPAYEVSNHAAPGLESRHNLIYWRAGDWLGIGPGAHGRFGMAADRRATLSERAPEAWLATVARADCGVIDVQRNDPLGHAEEYLMTAFRLAEGLDQDRLTRLGLTLPDQAVIDLVGEDLLRSDGPYLRTTARGRALADGVASYLGARSIPTLDSASQS